MSPTSQTSGTRFKISCAVRHYKISTEAPFSNTRVVWLLSAQKTRLLAYTTLKKLKKHRHLTQTPRKTVLWRFIRWERDARTRKACQVTPLSSSYINSKHKSMGGLANTGKGRLLRQVRNEATTGPYWGVLPISLLS